MKIAIVEDSKNDRFIANRILKKIKGVKVEFFSDPRDLEGKFDLIISDFIMPKMNGVEFVREFRKKDLTPIIIYSSLPFDDFVKEAYEEGVNAYLKKAVGYSEIESQLTDIVNFWKRNLTINI